MYYEFYFLSSVLYIFLLERAEGKPHPCVHTLALGQCCTGRMLRNVSDALYNGYQRV